RCFRDGHPGLLPARDQLALVTALDRLASDGDGAGIRPEEADRVAQEDRLPRAAPAEHDDRLPLQDSQIQARQHLFRAERFVDLLEPQERLGAHSQRRSFARKKFEMKIVIEAATTVLRVARPTPSAPPDVLSPL